MINGTVVKWDSSHLTVAFAQSLAPEVDIYLKGVGILDTAAPSTTLRVAG